MYQANFLACLRLVLIGLAVITITPFHWLSFRLNRKWAYKIGRIFLSTWRWCIGHQLHIKGKLSLNSPTLYIANHSSYVDILICGSFIPGRFVAKKEVASWPLIGWLSSLQGTLYIDRSRTAISEGISQLEDPVNQGESLILFPEGTTSDGCRVLPFGSSFFDIALRKNINIQPISITYAGWDGMPMPRYVRKMCGWASPDLKLIPHLWNLLKLGKIQTVVELHPPIKADNYSSRKTLAEACWEAVNKGMNNAFAVPLIQQEYDKRYA